MKEDYKNFQIRLPTTLYENFFRAFPGRGERKVLLERLIEAAVDLANGKDQFIKAIIEEARERYGEAEEDYR